DRRAGARGIGGPGDPDGRGREGWSGAADPALAPSIARPGPAPVVRPAAALVFGPARAGQPGLQRTLGGAARRRARRCPAAADLRHGGAAARGVADDVRSLPAGSGAGDPTAPRGAAARRLPGAAPQSGAAAGAPAPGGGGGPAPLRPGARAALAP